MRIQRTISNARTVAILGAVVGALVFAGSLLALVAGATALAYAADGSAAPLGPPPVPNGGLGFDLTVGSVEVTQATQTATNSIPLVARRSTAVRTTIDVSGTALPFCCATGALHVFVNGIEVTPPGGVPPINPLVVHGQPDRNNERDTLNFELPAPTPITASTDVDFRVDVREVSTRSGETNVANNTGFANDMTAVERCTPWLYFTRIDYTPSGLGLPPLSQVRAGKGDAFVRGVLPVDDSDRLYSETTPLTFSWDPNGDRVLGGEQVAYQGEYEQNKLLKLLEMGRQLIVENWIGATDRVFLYGWIAGNPIYGHGGAWKSGRVAFGNTSDLRYQRTYAHELIHNFGLGHNDLPGLPLGLDEVGWDVGARLVGNPAGNNVRGRVKPVTDPIHGPYFDVMTAAKLTHEAWINTRNYEYLLQHPTLAGGCLTPSFSRVAVLRGVIRPDGQALARLEPVFRLPWKSEPSETRKGGQFLAEVTDTNGVTTTRLFDVLASEHTDDESSGAFTIMVPVDPSAEIASLRIMSADGTQLAEMLRSEPPRIELLSPQPGSVLGDKTEVQWAVDDPDTTDDQLLFEAAYSNDGGRSWAPLQVDIPGTERGFTFDASQLPSTGAGVIRVFVSDGLNTAFADVTTG